MLLGLIIGIIIGVVLNALVIWIVGKLNLGLRVSGFGGAIMAAIIIAVVSWIVTWLLGLIGITVGGGLIGAIVITLIFASATLPMIRSAIPSSQADMAQQCPAETRPCQPLAMVCSASSSKLCQ